MSRSCKLYESAFTLVELMIVVAVISVISAIAIPNFLKSNEAAKKTTCIGNMHKIRDAVDVWALNTNAANDAVPLETDISPNYLRVWPKCSGTKYDVPAVGANPICPIAEETHTLDAVEA